MKRKLTALLLAMTFVFATVAPTMAASRQANASSNKTATVSVEKTKRRRNPLAAVKSLFSTKKEDPVKVGEKKEKKEPAAAKSDDTGANNATSTPPEKPVVSHVNGDEEDQEKDKKSDEKNNKEEAVKPVEFTFGLVDENGNNLSGAILTLTNENVKADDKQEKPFITDENPKELKLAPGKYKLEIIRAPKGYKESSAEFEIVKSEKPEESKETIEFKVDGKTLKFDKDKKILTMTAEKEESKLFFSLRDIAGKELAGANVTIKQDGKTLEATFETKDQPTELPLDKGEYELIVTKLPDGYKLEKDTIKFEIKEDGKLVPAEADKEYLETKDGNYTLFLKAAPVENQFFFRLKDSNGKDIIGPELQIKDSAGKVIKWFSEKNPKGIDIKEFADGTYEFSQTVPYGHTAAEPILFTVKDNKIIDAGYGLTNFGPYQELALVSKSAKRVVTFSRVDSLGKILLGVEIEIYKDGTKIDSWKSGSDHHKLELEAGVYRYHEAAVVLGHKIAKDFEFEVKADGSIVLRGIQLGENVKLKEGGLICVGEAGGKLEEDPNKKPEEKPGQTNQKKPTTDKKAQAKNHWVEFDVAKKDGTLLEGAVVEIYQNGKLLESWTTSNTGYKTQLQQGTYRFHTKTAPQGYQLARDFNFAVNRDGSITLGKLQSGDTVTAKDGRIVVYGDPVSATGTRTSGTTTAASNGRLPKTGDGISPVFYAVGLAAVGAVILGIGIKKRRESVDEVK